MVKGKYINEKARAAYKKAEKKSAVTNVEEGAIDMILASRLDNIRDDMLKMMDKIDALESAVKILSNRLNRVDGMGK